MQTKPNLVLLYAALMPLCVTRTKYFRDAIVLQKGRKKQLETIPKNPAIASP
jgi:hypothetical protein